VARPGDAGAVYFATTRLCVTGRGIVAIWIGVVSHWIGCSTGPDMPLYPASTLCHEFCHHLDYRRFGFRDSWHTRGFYERTGSLYHHVRGTPPKRLFWAAVPGGRWRIDWPRTNRASEVERGQEMQSSHAPAEIVRPLAASTTT
jgi:hypothetical protein